MTEIELWDWVVYLREARGLEYDENTGEFREPPEK
jgi:hypothetical protein